MIAYLSFSLFAYLFTLLLGFNTIFALDIQLRPKIKTGKGHICLSDLIESITLEKDQSEKEDHVEENNNDDTSTFASQLEEEQEISLKIMSLLGKECHMEAEHKPRFISKKEFKGLLQKLDLPDGQELNILGDRCKIIFLLKKIPFQAMQSFVTRKTGGYYSIIKGKDVLIPKDMNIFFEINRLEKIFFVKAHMENDQKITYAQFQLKSKKLSAYDINSGNKITLLLNQDQIRVKFNGRALEPGRIGDVIKIRSSGLRSEQNFRARVINRHTAEILP